MTSWHSQVVIQVVICLFVYRHRKDTSPYSSDRGQGSGGSSSHLSPPDTSWRRVVSDSSLHHSVLGTNPGGSNLVSPAGSTGDIVGDHPALLGSNGAISPLQGASPTMHRRGKQIQMHSARQIVGKHAIRMINI